MDNELLVGRFDTNIDSKGRVKLPEEWGFAFGPGKLMYVVPAVDGRSLSLMPAQHWDGALSGLREKALFDPKADAALKKIGEESRIYTVSPDGTIELDSTILERGQLKTSVSFIGCCQNAKLYATENLPPDAVGDVDTPMKRGGIQE